MSNDSPEEHVHHDPEDREDVEHEPNFEELGELGGEIINDAAAEQDIGNVLGAAHTFVNMQSVYQSSGMASLLDSLRPIKRIIADQVSIEDFHNRITKSISDTIDFESKIPVKAISNLAPSFPDYAQLTGASALMESIAQISRAISWSDLFGDLPDLSQLVVPSNLRAVNVEGRIDEVCRVADKDGTSLAWAPRSEIVEELIDAADMGERDQVLHRRALDIIEDVEKSLTQVTHPDALWLRGALEEACEVGRAGAYIALQATATNVLDYVMNGWVLPYLQKNGEIPENSTEKKMESRRYFKACSVNDLEEADVGEVRLLLIGGGVVTAFDTWKEERGGLRSYSRNGSVHYIASASHPAHALRALLLAQALLRWIAHQVTADEDNS